MAGSRPVWLVVLGLLASVLIAGCGEVGVGPGEGSGSASLVVTRDYGRSEVGRFEVDELRSSTTALRALEAKLPVKTSYGGGFVDGIDGIDSRSGDDPADWFYFLNGIEAEVGAADIRLMPGDQVWWDYREWGEVMYVGSVVGSYPAPLSGGYRDEDWPVEFVCRTDRDTCDLVRGELEDDGIELDGKSGSKTIEVVVGPWKGIREDYGELGGPPSRSGVFATFTEGGLRLLDRTGREVVEESDRAGLVASVGGTGQPPTWIVTGTDGKGVREAAALLEPDRLARSYAVAAVDGESVRLPTERPRGRK